LLLDPGQEIWKRTGWNAAVLAASLFSHPKAPGQVLLSKPEDISEAQLSIILEDLSLLPIDQESSVESDFLAFWVGVILSPDVVSVSPNVFPLDGLLRPESVASCLCWLPPCFRSGMGWLVGGSKEHGQALGTRLVLDQRLNSDRSAIDHCIKDGRRILSAWNTVAADDDFKNATEKQSQVPVWEWESRWTYSPEEFLRRVTMLDDLLTNSEAGEHIIESLDEQLKSHGPLEDEIRDAARKLILAGFGTLPPSQTVLLLRDVLAGRAKLDDRTIERLDRASVVKEFVKQDLLPTISAIVLPGEVKLLIWQDLLLKEKDDQHVISALCSAVKDLETEPRGVSQGQILDLVKTVIGRTAERKSLIQWVPFLQENNQMWAALRDFLQLMVLERSERKTAGWYRDYLAFGQDAGGVRLIHATLEPQDVQQLINFLIREAQSGKDLKCEAEEWLTRLATSPLRMKVAVNDKLRIAGMLDGDWKFLRAMNELYLGKRQLPEIGEPPDEGELRSLQRELSELIKEMPAVDASPNLRELTEFLGVISNDVLDAMARLRPRLMWPQASDWLDGWRAVGRGALAEEEAIRLLVEGEELMIADLSLPQLGTEKLTHFCSQLLFDGTNEDDKQYCERLDRLSVKGRTDARFSQALAVALQSCDSDTMKRETFLRRFVGQESRLDHLCECVPDPVQDKVIAVIAEHDSKRFQEEADRLYGLTMSDEAVYTPYMLAVFRYLLGPGGREFKNQVGVSHHGLLESWSIDRKLKEITVIAENLEERDPTEYAEKNSQSNLPERSLRNRFMKLLQALWPTRLQRLLTSSSAPSNTDDQNTAHARSADEDLSAINESDNIDELGKTETVKNEEKDGPE
jgi:hypothetical protein